MKEEKAKEYLKNLKHPEIENYGLNCDTQLWADFNKELRLRELMSEERAFYNQLMMFKGLPHNCNYSEEFNEFEREYGLAKLSVHCAVGNIDKITYMWK